jgi:hypothetical protein
LTLWFTIWFLVILKLPAAYLAYVIWWAVKDPPEPGRGPGGAGVPAADDGGPRLFVPRRRRAPVPGRHPGPHGSPARRPLPGIAASRLRKAP